MITGTILIFGLLIHFLGDFALQTHEQAQKKSTSTEYLTLHVGVYSLVWLIALLPIFTFSNALGFASFTGVAHFLTDYCTSRLSKPFFTKQNFHDGFVVVGFDQMLHYIQLYYTFKLFL